MPRGRGCRDPRPSGPVRFSPVTARPFRFMAGAGRPNSRAELVEHARRAEALGYDALVIPDHLTQQLAPAPALAAVAAATPRLRLGTFVLNNDLRPPARVAAELATPS